MQMEILPLSKLCLTTIIICLLLSVKCAPLHTYTTELPIDVMNSDILTKDNEELSTPDKVGDRSNRLNTDALWDAVLSALVAAESDTHSKLLHQYRNAKRHNTAFNAPAREGMPGLRYVSPRKRSSFKFWKLQKLVTVQAPQIITM